MAKRRISVAIVFHALHDPTRRAIVERLSSRPYSVSQLAAPLGITVTAVAQHMQILEDAGLARSEKVGRVRTCSIARDGFELLQQWMNDRRSDWDRRLDRLGTLLDQDE